MILREITVNEIDWRLDFQPRHRAPDFLPVLCVAAEGKLVAVRGFEKRSADVPAIPVLVIDGALPEVVEALWPFESLAPLESQRLNGKMGRPVPFPFLLSLPLEFQNLLDDRQVPLRALKPLEYLTDWQANLVEVLVRLSPSSSQIREIIDLVCDLKFMGHSWTELSSHHGDASKWIIGLRKLRTPVASTQDESKAAAVRQLPWPRGVSAKWERQGDEAGVVIQTRVTNPFEWRRLQESLSKLDLQETIWN